MTSSLEFLKEWERIQKFDDAQEFRLGVVRLMQKLLLALAGSEVLIKVHEAMDKKRIF